MRKTGLSIIYKGGTTPHMNRKALIFAAAFALSSAAFALTPDQIQRMKREIAQAGYYLKEFEDEVARSRGGPKMVWRSKQDALLRSFVRSFVKIVLLMFFWPIPEAFV